MSTTTIGIKAFLASKAGIGLLTGAVLLGGLGTAGVFLATKDDKKEETPTALVQITSIPTPTIVPEPTTAPTAATTTTPTSAPQPELSTFKNTYGGYEVSFPKSWLPYGPKAPEGFGVGSCTVNPSADVEIVELSKTPLQQCGFSGLEQIPSPISEFSIYVSDEPHRNISDIFTYGVKTNVNGIEAYKYDFIKDPVLPNIKATRIYFNHNNKGYILYLKQKDAQGNYDPIYDQIIKSLKFTQDLKFRTVDGAINLTMTVGLSNNDLKIENLGSSGSNYKVYNSKNPSLFNLELNLPPDSSLMSYLETQKMPSVEFDPNIVRAKVEEGKYYYTSSILTDQNQCRARNGGALLKTPCGYGTSYDYPKSNTEKMKLFQITCNAKTSQGLDACNNIVESIKIK